MIKRMTWALILGLITLVPNSFGQATEEATKEATKQEEAVQEETAQEEPLIATDDKTKAFHKQLIGDWAVVSMQQGANEMPAEMTSRASFSFSDDGGLTLAGLGPGDTVCQVKLDASSEPAKISFKPEAESQWVTGIVKMNDEGQVVMCLTAPGGGEAPTEFKSDADTPTRMMAVLKKKEAEGSDDK